MELLVQILTISSVIMAGGAWLYDKLCKKFQDVQSSVNTKVSQEMCNQRRKNCPCKQQLAILEEVLKEKFGCSFSQERQRF